jgi:hypothetical protein
MLAANAGAMVSLDARTVVTANGGADLGVEHRGWRMGVRGAFESSADLDVSAAEVMVRHVPIAAYLGRRLAGGQPVVVTGAAGAGVDLVSARTSGYATPRSFSATDAIVLAELQGEWRVRRQLGVICAADLILALRRERYAIANLGPVANTSRLRAGLVLGVAWHLQ